DDPVDAINHMMSFLTAVVTSQYPPTNNQLRTSSNPRQQATINNRRVTIQLIQGRQNSMIADCDELNSAKIALVANLSHYGSDNLAEETLAIDFESWVWVVNWEVLCVLRIGRKAIQADCDVMAINIILQGLPSKVYALVSTHKVAKELWERIQMLMQEYHANEVRLMHERNSDPLALIAHHQMNKLTYQQHQQPYHQHQFQPQASTYQSSQNATPYHPPRAKVTCLSSAPSLRGGEMNSGLRIRCSRFKLRLMDKFFRKRS
nr:hypothetical protein [Tanacetum cinerariifolium]